MLMHVVTGTGIILPPYVGVPLVNIRFVTPEIFYLLFACFTLVSLACTASISYVFIKLQIRILFQHSKGSIKKTHYSFFFSVFVFPSALIF
jgi:uncharacterized membrane protein